MNGVITAFTFMDECLFIFRIATDIDIRTISSQEAVSLVQNGIEGTAFCYEGMEQIIPSLREKLIPLLDKS
mgnify:CR=1 FL=1